MRSPIVNPAAAPRLAVYIPELNQGGGELSMLRLAAGLAQHGRAVDLLVHRLQGAEVVPPHNLNLVELGTTSTAGSVRALARWLVSQRPRWLLSAFPHTNLAAVAAVKLAARHGVNCRSIISEHAPLSMQMHNRSGWRWRALPPLVRWAYPQADAVVAVSHGVRHDLLGLMGQQRGAEMLARLHIIANPVLDAAASVGSATPEAGTATAPDLAPESKATPLHPWLQDPRLQVVLSVCRLSSEKDIPTLLRAFALLHAQRPHTRLLLAGDGPERAALQTAIDTQGLDAVASLVGRVQGPQTWMRRATVLALASRYEGFGNVLVEALASGCAVVATDCPVGPREILADGRWGALVPVGDAPAMAVALQRAVDQPGAPAGAQAHVGQYTDAAACSAYGKLLDELEPC